MLMRLCLTAWVMVNVAVFLPLEIALLAQEPQAPAVDVVTGKPVPQVDAAGVLKPDPATQARTIALEQQLQTALARLGNAETQIQALGRAAAQAPAAPATRAQRRERRDALYKLCHDRGLAFDSLQVDKAGDALVVCR